MESKGEIIIYKAGNGTSQLDGKPVQENLPVNINQIAQLFDRDKSVISRYIKNPFIKELSQTVEFKKSTIVTRQLTYAETQGCLEIISRYTRSFILPNQFDNNTFQPGPPVEELAYELSYEQAGEPVATNDEYFNCQARNNFDSPSPPPIRYSTFEAFVIHSPFS